MSYSFNAEKAANECIQWIRDWFKENGDGCNAVLGISGGKDSSVAAALCVKALGKERVIGVLMPQGEQFDIDYSHELCALLDIKKIEVNIGEAVKALKEAFPFEASVQTVTNIPPRVRMTVLYAVSQTYNGRVVNTCNLSVQEIKAIGRYLGLPEKFVEKPPLDGLCGRTDEDNLGFKYAELDAYIREGIEPSPEKKERIDRLHRINQFKLRYFDTFKYSGD